MLNLTWVNFVVTKIVYINLVSVYKRNLAKLNARVLSLFKQFEVESTQADDFYILSLSFQFIAKVYHINEFLFIMHAYLRSNVYLDYIRNAIHIFKDSLCIKCFTHSLIHFSRN